MVVMVMSNNYNIGFLAQSVIVPIGLPFWLIPTDAEVNYNAKEIKLLMGR